tara:strand:+ start:4573 stop:4953 length:381 start_codon:yes stop_codon:yes gene_type:complete
MDFAKISQDMLYSGIPIELVAKEIRMLAYNHMIDQGIMESNALKFAEDMRKSVYRLEENKLEKITQEKIDSLESQFAIDVATKKAICMNCKFLMKPDSIYKKCQKCGCYMELKWRVPGMKCPIDLW